MSAVNSALSNGEWKAATVLGGSIVEALLLWALQEKHSTSEITSAVKKLVANKTLDKSPGSNLEKWDLFHLIEVAADLNEIIKDTEGRKKGVPALSEPRTPTCGASGFGSTNSIRANSFKS